MKKTISLVLCLSILCAVCVTVASAAVPVITQNAAAYYYRSGNTVYAYVYGAPAKANYYSSATVSLNVQYKRGPSMSDAGAKYTKSSQKTTNGGWGQGCARASTSVSAKNPADEIVKITASGRYVYYGIR